MKKLLFAFVLLIIIAGAGAPIVNGLLMEKIVKQARDDANTMYGEIGSDVSVEIVDYDRSFFSSTIEWKVNLGSFKTLYGIDEIILIEQAKHGYGGVVSTTSLEKNQWLNDFVNEKLGGKNPVELTTKYNLSGKIESKLAIDEFALQVENEVVKVKPGQVYFAFDEGFENLTTKMSLDGVSVDDLVAMDSLSLSSELEKISTYIWAGKTSYTVNAVKITGNDKNAELHNLKVDYSLNFDKNKSVLSVIMGSGIDYLHIDGKKLDKASVKIGVKGLDAKGFEEFMKLYLQMANTVMDEIALARQDPDRLQEIMEEQMVTIGLQMVGAYEKLLKKGLEIEISDLTVQLPEGEINGGIALGLKKDMTMAQFAPLIAQPELALEIFSLNSSISFPAELAGDNPALTSPVYPGMQTGIFVKNGGNLVHTAENRNGKLFLNDKEFLLN